MIKKGGQTVRGGSSLNLTLGLIFVITPGGKERNMKIAAEEENKGGKSVK